MNGLAAGPTITEGHLTDAFSSFIAAADRLERSHWQLHEEVSQLRAQLEERNRALASSKAENDRMRVALAQILDALPCGVAVLETNSEQIVLLNPEARRLLGIPEGEPALWTSLPSAIRTMLDPGHCQTWKQGDEHDFSFTAGDKSRCVTVRYSTIGHDDSSADSIAQNAQVILTCRDTTAFKEAEQQREASRNLVALAEMATVLAHEVRNPLGSMELLTGVLAGDSGMSEDSKHCVQHLQAGVRALSAVVNNVLRFYSEGTPNLQPTKLSEVLRSAVNFVQPLARQSGIGLTSELTLGEIEIAADASEVHQVILNLVCNALRHTPAGGLIKVCARVEPKAEQRVAVVEVADTGNGIRAEDLTHIFEPGFTTGRQSAGLGLTVCQRIVEQHRGKIMVSSEAGKGTTFHIEFPIL
ncbi:MAG TPA: ATP-binding protein [Terriglobales bacterium]|nr:ATP-binding protein [Terriglobales bacterium]